MDNPDLLILDEPLSGLDVTSALIIENLIQALSARGKSVFYCSHILEVVEKVCTHLIVLRKGHVIAHGATGEVRERIGSLAMNSSAEALGDLPANTVIDRSRLVTIRVSFSAGYTR
jgi:ABC-2 type transport system ATP-binding protein